MEESDEYEDEAEKTPHNNQQHPEDPQLEDDHNAVEQCEDDAHNEQDLAPCVRDAESMNEYDNEYDNTDNTQEWYQPQGAADKEPQECDQPLGVIGYDLTHK